jgi:glycerol-3-phosphate dehydrogenase
MSTNRFDSYTGRDPIGIELSGALKNVYAIAAGMSDGLGFENNTRASKYILIIACHFSHEWPT